MHAVLNSALPIFALILTGFICGYFGVFDRTATDNLNRFAVYLALPSLMFVAMSKITPDQVRELGFVGAFVGGFSASFAVAFAISRLRGRRVANASIEGLDAGYSNVGFMGIPMCLLVFGPESAPASIIATLFTACVFVPVRGGDRRDRPAERSELLVLPWTKVVSSLLRSPLLIAPVAGLAVGLSGLTLPAPLVELSRFCSAALRRRPRLICIGLFLAQERVVIQDATTIGILVFIEADPAAGGDGAARLSRLLNAAFVVALGRDPERAADRLGPVHHRKALRARGRCHIRCYSRVARFRRPDRLASCRLARTGLILPTAPESSK